MAKGKDLSSEQNISEVLAMLKQSVDTDGSDANDFEETPPTNAGSMSEEDLKQRLRMQYMSSEAEDETGESDIYEIDEAFLDEAVTEPEEEPQEEPQEELEKEIEEELDDEPLTVDDINAAEVQSVACPADAQEIGIPVGMREISKHRKLDDLVLIASHIYLVELSAVSIGKHHIVSDHSCISRHGKLIGLCHRARLRKAIYQGKGLHTTPVLSDHQSLTAVSHPFSYYT